VWIATKEQSQEIDRRATEEFGVPAMVLMERAGLAVYEAVDQLLKGHGRVMVFCGHGNNGGDGFVAARILLEHGYHVDCLVAAEESHLREECRLQMLQAQAQGVHPIYSSDPRFERKLECLGHHDLIIDALLGLGAEGQLHGPVKNSIEAINRSGVPVVSVDVPSGLDCNSGQDLGASVWALRTVTFGLPKPFLFQGVGLEHSGYWSVAKIGFPPELLATPCSAKLIEKEWVAGLLPERFRDSHKGTNGRLLIVAGSNQMRGAAILAAKAALRSGIGLITVAGIESVCQAVMAHIPEATLLPLPEREGVIAPEAADLILHHQAQFSASLFGPGMTHEPPVKDFLTRLWNRWEVPSVIDADALNAVSTGINLPAAPCVLTPHPGEMARLLGQSVEEIQADRFSSSFAATKKFGKTVLLKGPYSIVANDSDPMMVNQTGNSGMASAGMGDVLSGVIATLLAQELHPDEAAAAGMYWHGLSGDLCAQEIGHIGFTARDVATHLPAARAKLIES
jgi:NAD(P)H-hydrate epimerase